MQREITQRYDVPAEFMAEDAVLEANILVDEHDEMPFRLKDIKLDKLFADLNPRFAKLDLLRKELTFQYRLMRHEWGRPQVMTILTGVAAFLLGAISIELFDGGNARVTGLDGLASISGFEYFQIILSGILWIWFLVQVSVNFPIMRGHIVNLMIIWIAAFSSQLLFHVSAPDFPVGASLGESLGGVILLAVAAFFTYFFWKAVSETRDLHVQEHHLHTDVRVMEEAMEEHSLFAWTFMVLFWLGLLVINGWAGAHFVADRSADRIGILVLHVITGILLILIMMHVMWFPQRMLGEGTRVRTRAAASAEKDLLGNVMTLIEEGECANCGASAPVSRDDSGDLLIDCPTTDCNRRGVIGTECEGCGVTYPTRLVCKSCGVNSPVADYMPDLEAW